MADKIKYLGQTGLDTLIDNIKKEFEKSGSDVSYVSDITEGTKIGTITINGEEIDVIAPSTSTGLEHSLTIGNYIFDGTADITVPVYNGD